uniref:Uncharacterized protein n=1 Tax=Arundo donax TaxID=35708 RepID=A0A0A9F791_ARUDO
MDIKLRVRRQNRMCDHPPISKDSDDVDCKVPCVLLFLFYCELQIQIYVDPFTSLM